MNKLKRTMVMMHVVIFLLTGAVSAAAYADNKEDALIDYKDVKASDWFSEAVDKLSRMSIINGMTPDCFNPQGEVTRAQFIKMLVQAMEYNKIDSVSFVDMKANSQSKPHWASVYVETALRNGVIIKAEEGDRFYPDVPLTREAMVMMMFRALKLEASNGANPYFDLEEPNGCFTKLYEEYLVRGIPMNDKIIFNSTGVTTRAQASVIISRLVDYKEDPEGFVARAGMEERFASGTQTAEDIVLKRQIEIEKAKDDPNYIMGPIITIERNEEYKDYRWFEMYFENETDYSDDAKWKLECVNYEQLNSFEIPKPDGTFVKKSNTNWRPLGSEYKDQPRTPSYILGKNYYTTQAQIKDFKLYSGMKIEYKITIKDGKQQKVIYKAITLQD